MTKKHLLALVASLGMTVATGAQAATASGTVTHLKTTSDGIVVFKLSSTGATLYHLFDPNWEAFYTSESFGAMVARLSSALASSEDITITFTGSNCGGGFSTCPTAIE